jgi:hypothetical protein
MTDLPITTANLWAEAQTIQLSLVRTSPTSFTLTWNLPATPAAYNGHVIVVAAKQLTADHQPVDSVRYTASTDLTAPADTIGGAQVVNAVYGAFGDSLTATSVLVTGADPNLIYYASLHPCSNVLQYYQYGCKSYALEAAPLSVEVQGYTGNIPRNSTPPTNPAVGYVYYNPTTNSIQMWNGAIWIPANATQNVSSSATLDGAAGNTIISGKVFPTTPNPGDFFYRTDIHILYIWTGTQWKTANTEEVGTPTYEKIGVGTTGDLDSRAKLVNSIKAQLGYPAVCTELKEENFETAINIALAEFRRRSDSAYNRRHILFTLKAGQSTYFLNDPVSGTDKIVDIQKIHRVSTIGMNVLGGDNGVYAQIFYNQFFYGSMIDILSIHLANSMAEEFEKIFAGTLVFEWDEAKRELKMLRKLYKDERVVLECYMERTEQELLTDRWCEPWIRDWAFAKCLEMTGMIRSKYANLPGANGGLALNGDMLITKAETMFTELQRQINDFEAGNLNPVGNVCFLMG